MSSQAITNRYDFVLFYDVENGNPNGDPDAGNMPRMDPETGHGIVTDVCIKRKIRNAVDEFKDGAQRYRIYVKEGSVLNDTHSEAYKHLGIESQEKKLPKDIETAKKVTAFMCDNFYDIRTFGAVMTTKVNCGQVRGPVQLAFSRSLEPIFPHNISITRMAATNESEEGGDNKTMGRKFVVPYGAYRLEGFISASYAKKTGFSEEDLELLWKAIEQMFEFDRSAARGKMTARKLYVFKHDSVHGNAHSHKLFDLIKAEKIDPEKPSRAFTDYDIKVDTKSVPEGVEFIEKF